ncbi:MAG: tetratricopeptide repeat protein [Clostridia bacterium]|nr:tetratricopeptide repeat protein [Clostridia bacterium]
MAKILTFKNNLQYYLHLYDSRMLDGDLLGAIDACRSAFSHAKTRIQRDSISLLLGQVYYNMGLYTLSCDYYFRAVSVPASRASAYLGIARNLIMLDRLTLAVEYLDNVLEWDYMDLYTQDVLDLNNSIKSRLQEYQSLSGMDKIKNNIHKLFKLHQHTELDTYLTELSTLYTSDCEFQILSAKNKIYLQDYSSARIILFELLEHTPNYPPALVLLARLCIILQDNNSAREYLHKLSLIPDLDTATILSIGGLHFELSNFEASIQCFQQILASNPYRPKLLLFTAICYYNLRDYKNALYYIGQARWIDFENPTLKQFYRIFNSAEYSDTISLNSQLPPDIATSILDAICNITQSQRFAEYFYDSTDNRDDIEWCLSLDSSSITNDLSMHITRLKNKKATAMVNKILLSSHYSNFSKFCITKHSFCSGNYKYLDLATHYTFRSFRTRIPTKYKRNTHLFHAIANARAYIECYAHKVDISTELHYISNLVLDNPKINADEYTLTCSFFYQYHTILMDVCRYFDVPVHSVQATLNELGVR